MEDRAQDMVIALLLDQSPLLQQLSIRFCDGGLDRAGGEVVQMAFLGLYKPVLNAIMGLTNLQDLYYPAYSVHFRRYVEEWSSTDDSVPLPSLRRLILECNCEEEVVRLFLPSD